MNERSHFPRSLAVGALAIILALSFTLMPLSVRAELPPRPTPISDDAEEAEPSGPPPGSLIQLHGEFPSAWPWVKIHWQTAWTMMQWQDHHGTWHDVEGWQGGFDKVYLASDGSVTGEKTWWLGKDNQGTGPFRWQVTLGPAGEHLATSEPFDLPEVDGQIKTLSISLNAPTMD